MSESWKRFSTLYAIQFLQLLDFISISPTGAIFVENHKIASGTISFSLGAYSLAAIVGSILLKKSSNYSAHSALVVLICLFSVSQLMLLINISDFCFIFSRIIGGLTGGIMGAISYSQLIVIDENNQGLWNGRIQTAQSAVSIVGLPICLFSINRFGSNQYFSGMILFALIVLLSVYFSTFLKTSPRWNNKALTLNRVSEHLDLVITGFLVYFISFLFISQFPNYLINFQKISPESLSIAYSIGGALTLLLSGFIGKTGDIMNVKVLLALFSALILAVQLLFIGRITSSRLYIILPLYFLLSAGRSIYQRGIILQKKSADSVSLHLINNISMRAGILCSGLFLGIMSSRDSNIAYVFNLSNAISIGFGIILVLGLLLDQLWRKVNASQ